MRARPYQGEHADNVSKLPCCEPKQASVRAYGTGQKLVGGCAPKPPLVTLMSIPYPLLSKMYLHL